MASSKHHQIQTFVIFDTESTGLPSPGNNPKFTELCFLALTRGELLTRQTFPRVLNKLVICCNPCKRISMKSSEITGLHNDALEMLEPFRRQAALVTSFLKHLPQPVCIIAHNGNSFDFPLFISELKDTDETLPESILCADSLEALRTFDGLPAVPEFAAQRRKYVSDSKERIPTAVTERSNCFINVNKSAIVNPPTTGENKEEERSLQSNYVGAESLHGEATIRSSRESDVWNVSGSTPHRSVEQETKASNDTHTVKRKSTISVPEEILNKVRRHIFDDKTNDPFKEMAYGSTVDSNISDKIAQPLVTQKSDSINEISETEVFDDATLPYSLSAQSSFELQQSSSLGNSSKSLTNFTYSNVKTGLIKNSETELNAVVDPHSAESKSLEQTRLNDLRKSDTFESAVITDSEKELLQAAEKVDATILKDLGSKSSGSDIGLPNLNSKLPKDMNQIPGKSDHPIYVNNNSQNHGTGTATEARQSKLALKSSKEKKDVYTRVVEAHKEIRVSYSLPKVYSRMFGQEPEISHTAEDDCVTLLRIINLKSKDFVGWCDQNAVPLTSVFPMY